MRGEKKVCEHLFVPENVTAMRGMFFLNASKIRGNKSMLDILTESMNFPWLTELLIGIFCVVSPIEHSLGEDIVSRRAEIINEDQTVTL